MRVVRFARNPQSGRSCEVSGLDVVVLFGSQTLSAYQSGPGIRLAFVCKRLSLGQPLGLRFVYAIRLSLMRERKASEKRWAFLLAFCKCETYNFWESVVATQ